MRIRIKKITAVSASLVILLCGVGAFLFIASVEPVNASPGNQVRTVEYALGQRADPAPLAADTAWSPGATQVWLPETGVSVSSAWLELHAQAPATPAADVASIGITVNGVEYSAVNGRYTSQSGESCIVRVSADVTAAFSSFSSPFSMNPAVTIRGATSQGHSLKLFVTYVYNDASPVQVKTVRYPLGSRTAATAAGGTASIAYNTYIPESGVSVRSQWFEVTGQAYNGGAATDSFLTANLGGASTPAVYNEMQQLDTMDILYILRPAGFSPNTAQTLNLVAGGQAFYLLGGEVVITYEYDASSMEQLKTISYFMGQSAGASTAEASFSQNIYVPENGIRVRGLWLHLRANTSASLTHRVRAFVAGTAVAQQNFAVTANQENIGEHLIVYDMAAQSARLANGATLTAGTRYTATAGGPCGIEAFVTYSYNLSSTFQSKSVSFFSGQSPNGLATSSAQAFSTLLPESGAHTRRSAYLVCNIVSGATANYTHAVNVNGSGSSSVTMADTGEANSSSRLYEAAQIGASSATYTANFSSGNNAAWTGRAVVTYEIELTGPGSRPQAEVKTVEYAMGQRLDPANLAAGTAWSPPGATVYFPESEVVVRQAWLEFRAQAPSNPAANVTSIVFQVNGTGFPAVTDLGFFSTGESGILRARANITLLFDGVGSSLVLSPSVTVNGAVSQGHSLKLVVTYEAASSSATTQRTVRYPLASRTAFLSAGTSADYPYNAVIPEAGASVCSQWFEVKGQAYNGANTDSFLNANIGGGPATGNAYVEMNLRDSMDVEFLFQPSGFQTNLPQTLNLSAGGQRFHVLGSELVVTYTYDRNSSSQVKTVGYYLGENNASTTPIAFTQNIYLPESGVSVLEVWAQVRGNTSASINQNVAGSIAGNAVPQLNFSITANAENIGEHRIIYDMSAQAASLTNGSAVSVSTWYSAAGGGAFGVELFVTYRYDNELSGTQVQTVKYWAGQSSNANLTQASFRFYLWLPESDKTSRSAWLESNIVSRATAAYTHALDVNGTGASSFTMANTGEASTTSRLYGATQVGMSNSAYTCNASSGSAAGFGVVAHITYEYLVPTVSLAIDSMYDIDGNPSQFGEMRFLDVDPLTGTYIIGDDEPYAVRLKVSSNTNWQLVVESADFSDGAHIIPIGQLSFTPHGAGAWTPFAVTAVTVLDSQPPTGPGGANLELDYRLTVDWDDDPGVYSTAVVYTIISL